MARRRTWFFCFCCCSVHLERKSQQDLAESSSAISTRHEEHWKHLVIVGLLGLQRQWDRAKEGMELPC